jgi:hypothetical protein
MIRTLKLGVWGGLSVAICIWATAPPVCSAQVSVDVVITCDNAYGFGYGPATGMSNYFGGILNTSAGEIFNCGGGPEIYTVPGADVNDFLYIIGWSDDAITQGVLGQFKADQTVYTGQGAWEVYATGEDYDLNTGPSLSTINIHIATANAAAGASGSTSIGWVGTTLDPGREGVLVFGEDNTTPAGGTCDNPFPVVCPESSGEPNAIDAEATWMWYQRPDSDCAFREGEHREFLIFRIPVSEVAPPPVPVEKKSWGAIKTLYKSER